MRNIPFKRKLTSVVNTKGQTYSVSLKERPTITDSILLKNHNNGRNSGDHNWPKTFWAVYLYTGAVPMNYLNTTKNELQAFG